MGEFSEKIYEALHYAAHWNELLRYTHVIISRQSQSVFKNVRWKYNRYYYAILQAIINSLKTTLWRKTEKKIYSKIINNNDISTHNISKWSFCLNHKNKTPTKYVLAFTVWMSQIRIRFTLNSLSTFEILKNSIKTPLQRSHKGPF